MHINAFFLHHHTLLKPNFLDFFWWHLDIGAGSGTYYLTFFPVRNYSLTWGIRFGFRIPSLWTPFARGKLQAAVPTVCGWTYVGWLWLIDLRIMLNLSWVNGNEVWPRYFALDSPFRWIIYIIWRGPKLPILYIFVGAVRLFSPNLNFETPDIPWLWEENMSQQDGAAQKSQLGMNEWRYGLVLMLSQKL